MDKPEDEGLNLDQMQLRNISFVTDPIHPDWRVTHINGVYQESLKTVELYSSLPTVFVEYSAETDKFEELYDMKVWRKANDKYFTGLFKDKIKARIDQEARERSFRKRDLTDLRTAMHKLLATVFSNPEDHKQEFEGLMKDD